MSTNAGIRWYGDRVPVGRLFAGHEVGLEEIDHGLLEVYFGPIWLGRFVEPKRLIFDSLGRGQRRTGGTCKGRRTVTHVPLLKCVPCLFTGPGHISRAVGSEDRISVFLPLAEQ